MSPRTSSKTKPAAKRARKAKAPLKKKAEPAPDLLKKEEAKPEPIEVKEEPKPEKEEPKPEKVEPKPEPKAPAVVEEVAEAEPPEEEIPVAMPVKSDLEDFVPCVAQVTTHCRIGPNRYILEEGVEVRGGVLRAHLSTLEESGKVKRKA